MEDITMTDSEKWKERRDQVARYRVMEQEATDPLAAGLLRDIVSDLEADMDERRTEEAKMLNSPQNRRHGKAKRCAVCDGKFGLIRYYSWRTPLCSKECVDHFKARWEGDRKWLRRLQTA
jgi:hypothetical protein